MTAPHRWQDCRPAVVSLEESFDEEVRERTAAAVDATWKELTDAEKQAFHRVCCYNSRTEEDLAVVASIRDAMMAKLEAQVHPNGE